MRAWACSAMGAYSGAATFAASSRYFRASSIRSWALGHRGSAKEGCEDHRLSSESASTPGKFGGAGEERIGFREALGFFFVTQLGALVSRGEAGAESGLDRIQEEITGRQHREFRDGIDFRMRFSDASEGSGTRGGGQFGPSGVPSLILSSIPPIPREERARDQEQHEQIVHARCLEPGDKLVVEGGNRSDQWSEPA